MFLMRSLRLSCAWGGTRPLIKRTRKPRSRRRQVCPYILQQSRGVIAQRLLRCLVPDLCQPNDGCQGVRVGVGFRQLTLELSLPHTVAGLGEMPQAAGFQTIDHQTWPSLMVSRIAASSASAKVAGKLGARGSRLLSIGSPVRPADAHRLYQIVFAARQFLVYKIGEPAGVSSRGGLLTADPPIQSNGPRNDPQLPLPCQARQHNKCGPRT